jgi:hypothetical protein
LPISIGLAVADLLQSGAARAHAAQTASSKVVPDSKPVATPKVVRVAPEWQSRVPEIGPSQVAQTLRQASEALEREQLERGSSQGPGALELFLAVLAIEPENGQAQIGVQSALDALLERGRLAMRQGRWPTPRGSNLSRANCCPSIGFAGVPGSPATARGLALWRG